MTTKSDHSLLLAAYDEVLRREYGPLLCGVDECGRGAWASCLMAGAVVLAPDAVLPGLNDSKKLDKAERERLAELIKKTALAWAVCGVSAEDIDMFGLTAANRNAMLGAATAVRDALEWNVNLYVIDQAPSFSLSPHKMLAKADSTSLCVAAASVVAKVERDALMAEMDTAYPGYNFATNKGYVRDGHVAAVNRLGLYPIHRASYKVKGCTATSARQNAANPEASQEPKLFSQEITPEAD